MNKGKGRSYQETKHSPHPREFPHVPSRRAPVNGAIQCERFHCYYPSHVNIFLTFMFYYLYRELRQCVFFSLLVFKDFLLIVAFLYTCD